MNEHPVNLTIDGRAVKARQRALDDHARLDRQRAEPRELRRVELFRQHRRRPQGVTACSSRSTISPAR